MTKTFARKLKIPYSLQNKTALCEISPKENSRYKASETGRKRYFICT